MNALTQIFRLALFDVRREWALAVCQVFTLSAVLVPLLVLFGLKQGVLGQMLSDLETNPSMREIVPLVSGGNRFDAKWMAVARNRPDVAFVVGHARALAAEVEVVPADRPDRSAVLVVLTPTGPRDPLAGGTGAPWPAENDQVAISFAVARSLEIGPGGLLQILVPRTRNGADETQQLTVRVTTVLPPERIAETRRAVFATQALVLDVQRYRDGFAVPALGWPGSVPPAGEPYFERFRLYTRTIDEVGSVAAWLRSQGIEPVSRLEDIAPIQSLNRSLSVILLVISVFAGTGFFVALSATQWGSVERKRRELALLALVGYGRNWLIAIPLVQALVISITGTVVAVALFLVSATAINVRFPMAGVVGRACRLTTGELALAATLTSVMAVGAAILASYQATRIEPATAIRDY